MDDNVIAVDIIPEYRTYMEIVNRKKALHQFLNSIAVNKYRAKKREQGWKPFNVWIPANIKQDLYAYYRFLLTHHTNEELLQGKNANSVK